MRTVQKVDGLYRCIECGQESPDQSAPHRGRCSCYAASLPPRRARDDGPGTELKALLKDWLGIESSPTCSCNAMARKMNQLGAGWCESDAGLAEILGVLLDEVAALRARRRRLRPRRSGWRGRQPQPPHRPHAAAQRGRGGGRGAAGVPASRCEGVYLTPLPQ